MSRKSTSIQEVEDFLDANYEIRLNEVNYQLEVREFGSNELFHELNENDIFRDLHKQHKGISMATLLAILKSSYVTKYNPFQEYFDNISSLYNPEGTIDCIENLANYINAENQIRFNWQFKKMLVRSIACALDTNVFNKQAFVLVQKKQNNGKTTFCRWLCPPRLKEYFTENISMDKDGLIALTENFIINLDELSSLSKFELNTLKSVFSRDHVKVRPPYGTKSIRSPRRANFLGSINQFDFLNDETGSVRWLCFKIEEIDWNYRNELDIDLIWSQAYYLYTTGFEYQLTAGEIKENEIENEKFQYISPEEDMLVSALLPASKEEHDKFMSATDINAYLREHFHSKVIPKPVQLGKALSKLGYEQTQLKCRHGYYVKLVFSQEQ
ncbi:MAG: virulence protein E [Bacteroidetes bacterium B1(2017)]|nr:MAG: virulence protein E [Bacteroidetes bacterium B1(2017)]